MTTAIDYIPKELALPVVQNDNSVLTTEFPDMEARREEARPWLDRIDTYFKQDRTVNWQKDATYAMETYTNSARHNVRINLLSANTRIIGGTVYPKAARPTVDYRATKDKNLNKALKQFADMKQSAIEAVVDNGKFDMAMRKAITQSLITGRGILRFYTYQDYNKPYPEIQIQSIPYNHLIISPSDTFRSATYTIQKHVIQAEDIGAYLDTSMTSNPYPVAQSRYGGDSWLDEGWGHREDTLIIYEVISKYPTPHRMFIRDEDGIVLLKEPDPWNLPNLFPYSLPLIPIEDEAYPGCIPIVPFHLYEDLHDELNDSSDKAYDTLTESAIKYLSGSLGETAESRKFIKGGESDWFYDEDIYNKMREKGATSIADLIYAYPIKDNAEWMGFLDQRSLHLINQIYEISGVSDIQRGVTDPNETATAQMIKTSESSLRLKQFAENVREVVRDGFQIIADLLHRTMPQELIRLSGEIEIDEPIARMIMQPDNIHTYTDVESETLKIIDAEERRKAIMEAKGALLEFLTLADKMGRDNPRPLLAISDMYESIVDDLDLSHTTKRMMSEAWKEFDSDLEDDLRAEEKQIQQIMQQAAQNGQQIEEDQAKAIFKEQKQKKAQQKAIAMDPKHRKNQLDEKVKQMEFKTKAFEMQLEDRKQRENHAIALGNLAIARDTLTLLDQRENRKIEDLYEYNEAQIYIQGIEQAIKRYAIEEETKMKRLSLRQKQETGKTSYEDVEIDTESTLSS